MGVVFTYLGTSDRSAAFNPRTVPLAQLHHAGAELKVHVKCTSINDGRTTLCGEKGTHRVPDHGRCPVTLLSWLRVNDVWRIKWDRSLGVRDVVLPHDRRQHLCTPRVVLTLCQAAEKSFVAVQYT